MTVVLLYTYILCKVGVELSFCLFQIEHQISKNVKAFKFPLSHTCYNNLGTLFENNYPNIYVSKEQEHYPNIMFIRNVDTWVD